jgi:PAT family beta-lactamase induction signal transducer AmpG
VILPNLLATPRGRLGAFFLLYITEGIPLGFAVTAVATQLRRMGVEPAEVGAFVATFYIPWAFKWAFGPVIDVFKIRRLGHRRGWIMVMQVLLALTLMGLAWVPLPQGLALFTAILLVHNTFGAMQDVAIDALAVNSLSEQERGLANGLMFAGAMAGQALGGAGVLFLMGFTGFQGSFFLVAGAILVVTTLVVLPMRESVMSPAQPQAGVAAPPGHVSALAPEPGGWAQAASQMRQYTVQAFESFLGSRGAFSGVFFAILPAGAMSLALALQTTLSVELGMGDDEVATLALLSTLISGSFMVLGGLISDRLGRRRTLALYIALMSLPVLYLAFVLHQAGYIWARTPGSPPMPELIQHLWVATLLFNVAMGLMYGTRSAVFMDVTNPRVAGTQFTAYMAMMNLAIAFSATWQGVAIEALGYPKTLLIDATLGLACLLLLPWMKARREGQAEQPDAALRRARGSSAVLGVLCLAWLPFHHLHSASSAATGLAQTGFTVVFVASALVLYAGSLLNELPGAVSRLCKLLCLGLLFIYLRKFSPQLLEWGASESLIRTLNLGVDAIALVAALALLGLSRSAWSRLRPQ